MTMAQLFALIQKTMANEGLSIAKAVPSTQARCRFAIGDELSEKRLCGGIGGYTAVSGCCMEARVAPHKNQADADTSYYVEIDDWKYSKPKSYKRIKLSKSQTEPTLVRKLTAFISEYKEYVAQLELEAKIESLLKD